MSRIDKNLVEVRKNVFINKNDKNFLEKCQRYCPDNQDYMLKMAERHEKNDEYFKAKELYQKVLKLNPFHVPAADGAKRMQERLERLNRATAAALHMDKETNKYSKSKVILWVLVITLALLFAAMLVHAINPQYKLNFFNFTTHKATEFNVHKTVPEKLPISKPIDIHEIMIVENNEDEHVTQVLIQKAEQLKKANPGANIQITAYFQNEPCAKIVWNNGENGDVYLMNTAIQPISSKQVILSALQSALYRYAQINGSFPDKLEQLVQDYPNNYLSFIPQEPVSGSAKTSPLPDSSGGWAYSKPRTGNPSEVDMDLVLSPNINSPYLSAGILELKATPANLFLVSNKGQLLKKYPIASGKTNPFHEQEILIITKRIINPVKNSVLGTKILGLNRDALAIHGTNDNSSIGKKASLGCIRLKNDDVDELFDITPLGTPMQFSSKPPKLQIPKLLYVENKETENAKNSIPIQNKQQTQPNNNESSPSDYSKNSPSEPNPKTKQSPTENKSDKSNNPTSDSADDGKEKNQNVPNSESGSGGSGDGDAAGSGNEKTNPTKEDAPMGSTAPSTTPSSKSKPSNPKDDNKSTTSPKKNSDKPKKQPPKNPDNKKATKKPGKKPEKQDNQNKKPNDSGTPKNKKKPMDNKKSPADIPKLKKTSKTNESPVLNIKWK